MKKNVKVYVHRESEDNWNIARAIAQGRDNVYDQIRSLGYETELLFEVDTETGQSKLIGAEGFFLGEEKYNTLDIDLDEAHLEEEERE